MNLPRVTPTAYINASSHRWLTDLEMSHYLEKGKGQGEGFAPPHVQRRVELSPALSISLDRYFACA